MQAFINGQELPYKPSETILEAARRTGHYIPTLCELADIDHRPGTCRVCLVEIRRKGQQETRIGTACNTPMEDGLQVQTRTKKVREMQRIVQKAKGEEQ